MQVRPSLTVSNPYALSSSLAAKSQLTKANQTKTKMENLARELQKVKATLPHDTRI